MRYRAEIDGLRAFAVLPVILFHAKIASFSGGFVGVDIFFVISGYLITRILAGEMAEGRYSLMRFYERRARRILPALVAMIAISTMAAWYILPPLEMQWYGQSVLATALFVANFYFLFRGRDYFAGQTSEYPLLHTWTLAVEEQFYIIFPILLWLIWRSGPRRVFWIIAAISGVSLAAAEILSRIDPGVNFYLLPSRAWELGAGALCARIHHRAPQRENGALAAAGLVLVVGSILFLHEGLRFPSLWAVPPVLGTALILLYAGPATLTGRFLALRPFVWVGLASYSAYLWHQPLFAFTHVRLGHYPEPAIMLGLAALSVFLGWVSLHLIEAPFRRRGSASSARVVAVSGGVLTAVAGLGLALHLSLGAAGRPAAPHLPADYYASVAKPNFPSHGADWQSCAALCRLVDPPDPERRVALVGDSHAQDLILPLQAMARDQGWRLDLAINTGCRYTRLDGRREDCARAREAFATADWTAYDQVLLLNRFSGLYEQVPPDRRAGALFDYADLIRSIAEAGPQIAVFAPRPTLDADPVRRALAGQIDGIGVATDFAATPDWSRMVAEIAHLPGVRVIDQAGALYAMGCGDRACFTGHDAGGHAIFRDPSHLGQPAAAQLVADWAALPGS